MKIDAVRADDSGRYPDVMVNMLKKKPPLKAAFPL